MIQSSRKNAAPFLGLPTVWGTAFVAIQGGLAYFPPILYAALRYEIGGLFMLFLVALYYDRSRWIPKTRNDIYQIVFRALFVFAAFHIFLFFGQQFVPSAVGAIIVATNPILTAGFSRLLLPSSRLDFFNNWIIFSIYRSNHTY